MIMRRTSLRGWINSACFGAELTSESAPYSDLCSVRTVMQQGGCRRERSRDFILNRYVMRHVFAPAAGPSSQYSSHTLVALYFATLG